MNSIKIEKDKSVNERVRVDCGECKRQTNHTILASVDLYGSDTEYEIDWNEEFQIIQCLGCDTISFRKTSANSENCHHSEDSPPEYNVHEDLFPSHIKGRQALSHHLRLPDNIASIYLETLKALNSSQPILVGIGIRAIVETVVKERNAKGRDLKKKIDDLVTQSVLTTEGAKILHRLRVLGNKAAHEAAPHDESELSIATDVVEHLLQDVYILPRLAQKYLPDS